MLQIDILSVVPELMESMVGHSILKRAQAKGLLTIHLISLRKWAINSYGQVDDSQYGGGAGMVLRIEPLYQAITELQALKPYDLIILTSPCGQTFNQKMANKFSLYQRILIICGHYKGVDERLKLLFNIVEISIGDFVLTGGEIPAILMADAIGRLLPGVMNDETSALFDSFQDDLLAPPLYTKPAEFLGLKVPEILLQGDPKKIEAWRFEQSLEKTQMLRPDLLKDNFE
ncbi:MAG: tRNA (guanosine(37)-N1)-methyltransferase TrmD [Alphaproteobacteria bacterium]|nr:tRNA (guanosine(37)-N1)-methyltransferase TrmD [Alphaproteobacteria bacterium]